MPSHEAAMANMARVNTTIRSSSHPIINPTVAAFSSRMAGNDGSAAMIRKLAGGKYRLYSRRKNPRTGKRRNLGTFSSKKAAQQHEREVQYFKRH
jgi:hypothetical protein